MEEMRPPANNDSDLDCGFGNVREQVPLTVSAHLNVREEQEPVQAPTRLTTQRRAFKHTWDEDKCFEGEVDKNNQWNQTRHQMKHHKDPPSSPVTIRKHASSQESKARQWVTRKLLQRQAETSLSTSTDLPTRRRHFILHSHCVSV